jgi:hypothetical protein
VTKVRCNIKKTVAILFQSYEKITVRRKASLDWNEAISKQGKDVKSSEVKNLIEHALKLDRYKKNDFLKVVDVFSLSNTTSDTSFQTCEKKIDAQFIFYFFWNEITTVFPVLQRPSVTPLQS